MDRLCKKLKEGVASAGEAKEAYLSLTSSADPGKVEQWHKEADDAQANRDDHPEAMDIYDMKWIPRKSDLLRCHSDVSDV